MSTGLTYGRAWWGTLLLVIVLLPEAALAYKDCTRPITRVWAGYDPNGNRVYVQHGDGYGDSELRAPFVGNDVQIIDRILSVILSAKLSNKDVTFRYEQGADGSAASCTPTVKQQLIGAWIRF